MSFRTTWTPGGFRRVSFFAALLILAAAPARAADYRDELLAQARDARLAAAPQWHALLHYEPDWLGGGVVSEADSPGFFLAAAGATDPQAELEATLDAFFAPPGDDANRHAQCRYPARFDWLARTLDVDQARLPRLVCPEYEEWAGEIGAARVTLVFPAAYLNNPASMYGHTLLRLDPAAERAAALPAYAINFAALTDERSGMMFAVRGLAGLYRGGYSVLPYYQKVNTYNDIENRDIWEYPLDYTPAETRFLLLHLWELKDAWFDYYFLDENCSYQLLTLLEAVRPGTDLPRRFPLYAIPVDTVRETLLEAGGGAPVFRPGLAARVRAQFDALDPAARPVAKALARGELAPGDPAVLALPEAARAAALEAAYELQQYESRRARLPREAYARSAMALLRARSALAAGPAEIEVPRPAVAPHEGHDTGRIEWNLGRLDETAYAEFRVRPAYHDLLDPPAGHVPGAQIEMFAATLRAVEREGLELERIDAVNIVSLAPREEFRAALSWKFNIGLRHGWLAPDVRERTFAMDLGSGWAWQAGGVTTALFGEAVLLADRDLPGPYAAVGGGVSALVLWEAAPRTRLALDLRAERYPGDLDLSRGAASLRLQHDLGRGAGLRLGVGREGPRDAALNAIQAGIVWYF